MALSAVGSASLVIAEINPEMPVIHGAGFVSMDHIDLGAGREHPSINTKAALRKSESRAIPLDPRCASASILPAHRVTPPANPQPDGAKIR